MIEVPPKIWKPKVISKFRMPENNDIDEGVFDFRSYGKCVFRPDTCWDAGTRYDIITFDESKHSAELKKDLNLGANVSPDISNHIISITVPLH